jgi:hypothetical protein
MLRKYQLQFLTRFHAEYRLFYVVQNSVRRMGLYGFVHAAMASVQD